MENGPFIADLPIRIENGDFPHLMLVYRRASWFITLSKGLYKSICIYTPTLVFVRFLLADRSMLDGC